MNMAADISIRLLPNTLLSIDSVQRNRFVLEQEDLNAVIYCDFCALELF